MLATRSRFGSVGVVVTAAVSLVVGGCLDNGAGVVLDDLVITTATTGLDTAPGGYLVVVEDLGSRTIGPSGTVTFESVTSGSYIVELTGIPANCTLAGANPRTVTTGSGNLLAGRFEVSCVTNLGTVEVTVTSSGEAVPDGYSLVLGNTRNETVTANGVTVIGGVPAGNTSAELVVPGNCTLQGENPRTLAVPFSDAASTTFEVTCVANEGALEVITSTGGGDLDPDGYTVVVAGTLSAAMGLNDVVIFDPLTPGDVVVELTNVAANCVVSGDNPRAVSVATSDTVSTTFEVECAPRDMEVTTITTGMSLPGGFTLAVEGQPDRAIGLNESIVLYGLPADDYLVGLPGLPDHCEVVNGSNPRTVTVSSGLGSTTFEVTCWGWLVFDSNRAGSFDVFTMRHDGSQQTNLTAAPGSNDRQPVVSPNGTKIAFASTRSGTEHIWVMNRDGTGVPQQLTTVNRAKEPYWSPDGTKIVFSARIPGDQWDIWVMDANGQNQVNLTNDAAHDGRPEWSPDGTKLAFDSGGDIYVMNVNGSGRTFLTAGGGNATWSPDGERIAFTGATNGVLDVWVMNADGSNRINLTNSVVAEDGEPAWSPDGTTIAFMTARHGGREIYLMNPDGTNLRRLTDNADDDMWPSWVPIP